VLVNVYRSKIHRARITRLDLDYEGSITLDEEMIRAAGLFPHERVQVLNHSTGDRMETYVIVGEKGSGVVGLNGPAARRGEVGDLVTIIAYAWLTEQEAKEWSPLTVTVDENNRVSGARR